MAALVEIVEETPFGEAQMDDDGLGRGPITVRVAVTVAGESIAVDFAGTDPQVGTNLNCPFASLISASVAAISCAWAK